MSSEKIEMKQGTSEAHTSRFCHSGLLEIKEVDSKLIVKGYIATTHPDAVNDIITKETLDKWATEINAGVPRANKVSYHHDRSDARVVGRGIEGTAEVKQLPDGHYGLYVESLINNTHPNYDVIKKEVDDKMIDSFSIEYLAKSTKEEGADFRILDESTELYGWTLASRPVNEHAVMIKELFSRGPSSAELGNEVKQMDETKVELTEAQLKELQELKEYKEKMDAEQKAADEKKKQEEYAKKKEEEEKEMKETLKKEILAGILESKELNDKFDALADKPTMEQKENEHPVSVEYKEFSEALENKELVPSAKLLASVNLALKEGLLSKGTGLVEERLDSKGFDHFRTNGTKLQYKSVGLSSDLAGASSAAALSAHRSPNLVEALDAGIYNLLNDAVSAFDFVQKTSAAGSGSDHATFVVRSGRNPTAGAYVGNEVSTGKATKQKFSTRFKKYKAGFAVDGDLIAANRGAPQGSVLASEIEFATLDLKKEINIDLYTEQGLESSPKLIGFKYIANSAGNTTLYGETRSSANGLAPFAAADTYVSGATGSLKTHLRTLITNIEVDGGVRRNIRIFMHPVQMDRLKATEDSALRYDPGASNVGFAPSLTFEGVPVTEDVDCPKGEIYVIETSTVELRMWVPPTVEMLGKRSDSTEGFIKTYLAAVYKAPRRVTMLHSVPTA